MDIEIVNIILRLCTTQQTCLFEVSFLCNHCQEQNICSNSKYILASIRNYIEIFKISRDQNRIEFFMPFEICRNKFLNGICQNQDELCSNLHLCYDYFYTKSCRHSNNCSYPHVLTEIYHKNILGSLINLDLDLLTKAFRVYCQLNKHLSKGQSNSSSGKIITTSQLNGNSSWKINNRSIINSKSLSKEQFSEKGLQICWKPDKDIQTHFIEVIFSHQIKSNGGPIRTHKIYQHLGVAQVFYENSDLVDQVIFHGSIKFQSFLFIPRLLQRTIDQRHICLFNMPLNSDHIELYIDKISQPYRKISYEYYQNDQQIILIKYDEDINISKILSNVRNHPECDGLMINCIQLYLPETLFIEYNQEYSDEKIRQLFENENIFHIKTYSYCSFVHFYSHDDLLQSINKTFNEFIRMTPIYIDIYSQQHLNDYLQRREKSKLSSPPLISSENESIPILSPLIDQEKLKSLSNSDDEDDLHDLPSEFDDDDDLFLDESIDNNGDMEFLRNAAKNLMSSLTEMEAASADTDTTDEPYSLLFGDDYLVTIKSRRFALAFLDYTQFRVEKQRNSDRFRLLTSLKKFKSNKNRLDNNQQQNEQTKINKKKRNKRNKKKKTTTNNDQNIDDEI